MTEPSAAELAADVELGNDERPRGATGQVLDEQALNAVREVLPDWDVQPFQLSRAVDVPGGTQALRTALEQVVTRTGRTPEFLITGDHLVVRVRTEGVAGVTADDVELATALDPVFPVRRPAGTSPAA